MFTVFGVNFEFVASAFGFSPKLTPKTINTNKHGFHRCSCDISSKWWPIIIHRDTSSLSEGLLWRCYVTAWDKPGFHSNAIAYVGKQPIMVATASTEHSYWLPLAFVAWKFHATNASDCVWMETGLLVVHTFASWNDDYAARLKYAVCVSKFVISCFSFWPEAPPSPPIN